MRTVADTVALFGVSVPVNIVIYDSYKCIICLSFSHMTYSFTINHWAGRGINQFLYFFYAAKPRDNTVYGTLGDTEVLLTHEQKMNAVQCGCRDILTCLDLIGRQHVRCMIEYSILYIEGSQVPTDYCKLITLITCHCIVENLFITSNQIWPLVEFQIWSWF